MIKKLLSGLCMVGMLSLCNEAAQPLNEITVQEPALTVMLDDNIRSLCYHIVELWNKDGRTCDNNDIAMLLDPGLQELDYETVLRAFDWCAHADWKPASDEATELVALAQEVYEELANEYTELTKQMTTRRRIKCKCFSKVTTRELIACTSTINQLIVSKRLVVQDCLQVNGLNGIVQTTGGCFFAEEQLGTDSIEDGAITNNKLADNSVSSDKIANNSILPSHLLFNTVDTFASEPDLLRIYRGSITGNTGVTSSGVGFTSSRTGVGAYTITFTQAYLNAGSYQIFVQPTTELDRNVTIVSQLAGSFSITVVDDASAAVDQNFMFFTIGTMV